MAKIKYDRDEVLDKAIELFWQRGYSASSMQQVVKATGLKPGSIYLAFGNKEGLYKEALKRYTEISVSSFKKLINQAESVEHGICQILENKIKETKCSEYCSCFLIKSQLELAAEKSELASYVSDQLRTIETVLRTSLEKVYDKELSATRATIIMMHNFGVRVYGYLPGSADSLKKVLQESIPWLPWAE